MNNRFPVLEKFHDLSQSDLKDRLDRETTALSNASATEQISHFHELRVYQLELEMQNRELRRAHQELEIARDKYASLYDFAPVAFITLDREGLIQEINMTGSFWLANKAPVDLVGQSFSNYISDSGKTSFYKYLDSIYDPIQRIKEAEFVLKRPHDSNVNARMHCMQHVDSVSQEKVCYMAILDLTNQRIAEQEARANREALSHNTRLAKLGEMASALAHEVSQPITAMITYIHILQKKLDKGVDRDELKGITEKIAAQANRSSSLLHQLRDFSRRQKIAKSRQSIIKIAKESIELLDAKLSSDDVRVNFVHTEELPDVYVDSKQIIQVFVNMIMNAIDSIASVDRAGIIDLEITKKDKLLIISIQDNGAGISDEVKDKLFMPFTTSKEFGLGVGLSLSRSIIESHGGQIWLDPSCENGAKIVFTLPYGE